METQKGVSHIGGACRSDVSANNIDHMVFKLLHLHSPCTDSGFLMSTRTSSSAEERGTKSLSGIVYNKLFRSAFKVQLNII